MARNEISLQSLKKVPIRYFWVDKGKPGFEHIYVGEVPSWQKSFYDRQEITLEQARELARKGIRVSGRVNREQLLAGQIPESKYYESVPGIGTFVPEETVQKHLAMLEKERRGEVKNIGTPERPLWVPTGSPAHKLAQTTRLRKPWEKPSFPQPAPQQTIQGGGLGEPLPFPKTQAEMEQYRKNYYWDPKTKKWYKTRPTLESITKGVEEVGEQVSDIEEQVLKILPDTSRGKIYQTSEGEKKRDKEKDEQIKTQSEILKNQQEIEKLRTQKELRDLRKELGLEPETGEPLKKPAVPTFASDLEALRSEYGLPALESQINKIEQEIQAVQDSLTAGLYKEEGRLAPMELIGTRQRELQRQAQETLAALDRRERTLLDEYNTKLNIVNQLMKLKQLDYQVAHDNYVEEFNQRIKLLDILDRQRKEERIEENQLRDDARANLTILQNLAQESGKDWDDLDPTLRSEIQKLELKADLPVGITKAFLNAKPGSKLLYTTKGVDENGNEIVTFIYEDPATGMPGVVKTITTGAVSEEETAGKLEGVLVELPSGERIDITTIEGLRKAKEAGASYAEVKSVLDSQTKWTESTIKEMLKTAGYRSPEEERIKEGELELLRELIEDYKKDWAKGGDEKAGTREQFARSIISGFDVLTPDEILREVYRLVPDEWLAQNNPKTKKKWWQFWK